MIKIDTKKCILCGVCNNVAPMLFTQNDELKTITVDQGQASVYPHHLQFAKDACPMQCISNE